MTEATTDNMLKIFVGNLPFSATSDDLQKLFSCCGDIQGINIRKDPKTHNPRGFAFVTFTSEDAALSAIASKHGFLYGGRALTVCPATLRGAAATSKQQSTDDSWKTAPIPRGKGKSHKKAASSKDGPQRRSWVEWAGPKAPEKTSS